MNKYLFILILAFASSNMGIAQNTELNAIPNLHEFIAAAKKENWKHAKQKNGITISYRKVVLFDTIKTRELMVKFTLSRTLDSILAQIKQPDKLRSWNNGVRRAKLLKDNDTNWVLYTEYKIPFPFSQQDLVASYNLEKRSNTVVISSKSLPNFIEPIKGLTREGYNLSQWLVTEKDNGLFEIKFSAISLTNSSIPRWIKDPVIRSMLIKSFSKFKTGLL